ncbi:MAG: CYTH domain-containing protein [Phycisphaeraceae bacterium]|nr:MAG: CYTH domain-containing protein [Phycisphaeraceae bacterium]
MATEIERKFLVDGPLGFDGPGRVMLQGYIALDADGTEVRLRREAGLNTLAFKRGGGMVRTEIEIDIDDDKAEALWALTEGRRLSKSRYIRPYLNHRVEIDVYGGALSGLLVAEVEFESEEAAKAFEPPEWFGREVTGDAKFRNNALARLSEPPSLTD